MDGTDSLPKCYDIDGDIEQLQFCVTLFSVDQSIGTFLSMARKESDETAKAKFGEEREEEQRNIGWMETVPKPTIEIAKGEMAKEGDKEEEEVGQGSDNGMEQRENGQGAQQRPRGRQRSALSHRIFTFCESDKTLINAEAAKSDERKSTKQRAVPREIASAPMDPIQILSSDQRLTNRRLKEQNEQRMRIMAYLGGDRDYDPSEEHLLWELRVANGRRLVTDWDLDKTRSVNSAKTGRVFRAQLRVNESTLMEQLGEEEEKGQNVWEGRTDEEEKEEERWEDEGAGDGFEVPRGDDDYWTHWMIVIGRGVGFLHDNLRVEWAMELPEQCQYLSAQQLAAESADDDSQQLKDEQQRVNGMSQRCAVKSVRTEDVAQFGCPIEFTLNYGQPLTNSSEQLRNAWPRILFTVTAEDSWGRIYIGGFAVLPLPVTFDPSPRHFWLDCVRPISPLSKMCSLREAHLGQAGELAQFKSLGEKMFNQEGIDTEFGGKLEITLNNIHQCRRFISYDNLRSLKYSTMMRRIGISEELQCRIAKVLAEFERVRRQLIKVRKGQIVIKK